MLFETLRKRRSVRRFKSIAVEQEKLDQLLEAVLRSPSSRNLCPWEFIVVQDQTTLQKLAQVKPHGGTFLQNAPLAVVICANPNACDVWIEDCSIAALLLHLGATDLGLGSCWVQIRLREQVVSGAAAEDAVKKILDIPQDMVVEAIVAIGYAAEEKPGHEAETLLWERIHQERFTKK